MTKIGLISIYANVVAIIMALGVFVLAGRCRIKDPMEKTIFRSLLGIIMMMSVFYILTLLRDDKVFTCNHAGAMLLETGLELLISSLAVMWFIYLDYRLFHSKGHLKRAMLKILFPFLIVLAVDLVNIFTGVLFYFDDELIYHERPLYIVASVIMVGYYIGSLIYLTICKRRDDKMKFFSVGPFFAPMVLYVLIYYFTPFATVTLGITVGLALLYAEIINEQCYQDSDTGFFNRLYLSYLRELMEKQAYDLESAVLIRVPEEEVQTAAGLITKQLPDDCDTIRIGKDTVLTLAHVQDRAPLHMLAEDVEMSLEEAEISVKVDYDLKKKKESCTEFLDRFLGKV